MKTLVNISLIILLVAAIMLSGCMYANVKTPLDIDLDKTTLGQKTGKASTYSVLWLIAWGDGSTAAAAADGNLSTINHMDVELYSILFGVYSRSTTVVYGN
jgi:hypothetical protein